MSKLTPNVKKAINLAKKSEALTKKIRKDHNRILYLRSIKDVFVKAILKIECRVQDNNNQREKLQQNAEDLFALQDA